VSSPAFASALGMPESIGRWPNAAVPGTVYCDPMARQVLLVYSQPGSSRLEFVQFCQKPTAAAS
jgi:hypothetical protein